MIIGESAGLQLLVTFGVFKVDIPFGDQIAHFPLTLFGGHELDFNMVCLGAYLLISVAIVNNGKIVEHHGIGIRIGHDSVFGHIEPERVKSFQHGIVATLTVRPLAESLRLGVVQPDAAGTRGNEHFIATIGIDFEMLTLQLYAGE